MDRLIERLATTTDGLVRFPTVEHNREALHHCAEWTRAHVVKHKPRITTKLFSSNGKPSVLFTAGDAPPRVLMCGHLDVVEDIHGDYSTSETARHLHGRGTADMKGPIAAMIDIMEYEPVTGMGLLLTSDEEVGGLDGMAYVLGQLPWRPEVAIVPDGGANMQLVLEQKGLLHLRLKATGEPAHGSRPWKGDNAIEKLYAGYQKLRRAYPQPQSEDDWRISINLSEFHGGLTANSVPHHAEATLDIRYPQTKAPAGDDLVRSIRRRLAPLGIEVHVQKTAPAFRLDADAPVVTRMQAAARQVLHHEMPLTRECGASDAHYLADEGVPVLMFQPECAEWHGENEWVNLESLATFRCMCLTFAKMYLGRSNGGASAVRSA
jgi:succinyl-diaminopimelate desuccinylase